MEEELCGQRREGWAGHDVADDDPEVYSDQDENTGLRQGPGKAGHVVEDDLEDESDDQQSHQRQRIMEFFPSQWGEVQFL